MTGASALAAILALPVYYRLNSRWQNRFLVAANVSFLFTLGLTTLIPDLVGGLICYFSLVSSRGRQWTGIALIAFLLVGFRIASFLAIATWPVGLTYFGLAWLATLFEFHWGRYRVLPTWEEFAAGVLFFPLSWAGPIERMSHLGPQLRERRVFSRELLHEALFLIGLAVMKISMVATPLAPILDFTWATQNLKCFWGFALYLVLAYAKIYTEFSGYVDLATGLALLTGIKIFKNFDRPYLAKNLGDIVKRWHISLGLWLRDFVYFPTLMKTRSLWFAFAVTLIVVGLWHGLTLDYILWTVYWILAALVYLAMLRFRWPHIRNKTMALWSSRAVLFTVMSGSGLCFLVPPLGWWRILHGFANFSFSEAQPVLDQVAVQGHGILLVAFSIALVILFENLKRETIYKRIWWLILLQIFSVISLGRFQAAGFFYFHF